MPILGTIMSELESQVGTAEALQLGEWLGCHKTLAGLAKGCCAADAKMLHAIREKKLYRKLNLDWDGFCTLHLGMSCRKADRIIDQLTEFGETFFNLGQLVKIFPTDYRAIQSAIHDNQIDVEGRTIAITPENSVELSDAVRKLRGPRATRSPLSRIERAFIHLFAEAQTLVKRKDQNAREIAQLEAISSMLASKLRDFNSELGQVIAHGQARGVIPYRY
jgi:hypothetical protein